MNNLNPYFIYKIKHGTLSLIIGITGWMVLLWLSYMINIDFTNKIGVDGKMLFHHYTSNISKYQNIEFDILIIILAIKGLYFGLKSVFKKNRNGYLGILISISLLTFKFHAIKIVEFWLEINYYLCL